MELDVLGEGTSGKQANADVLDIQHDGSTFV